MNCSNCGDVLYQGSRLSEDAYYPDGQGGHRHVTCPPEEERGDVVPSYDYEESTWPGFDED